MEYSTSLNFNCKTPCKTCPYRKDVPLQTWAIEEFETLYKTERDPLGVVYACHKKNGSVCIGWLMDQDKRYFPSIALRIKLTREKITREYLDSLYCAVPRFKNYIEMIRANFPQILKKKKDVKK